MTELKLAQGAWVVVCDGAKVLILENIGDPDYPDLRTRDVETQPDRPTADMGADRPGRVHQSSDPSRSAVEQTDWHDQAEAEFLKQLSDKLEKAAHAGEVKQLFIVAPPRALGMIRKTYGHAVKEALVGELDKDLTSMPVDEIERHLFGKRS